jgi:predicted secreted protein
MAAILGKVGYLYGPTATGQLQSQISAIANIDTWSLNLTGDAIDTTAFGTGSTVNSRTFDSGIKGANGSFSGNYDSASAHQDWLAEIMAETTIENVQLAMYINASHYFTMEAVVTGVTIGASVDGKVTFSADYTADGDVTLN